MADLQAEADRIARANGIDPKVFRALVHQESGWNTNARSPAGALGLTQLMPGTASGLGVTNPLDPIQSLEGGAKYLRQQLNAFGGNYRKALAAYNAGPAAVQKYGGVPPYAETQNYVRTILGNAGSPSNPAAPTGTVRARTRTTTTTTTPGVDNSALRRQLVADFLQQGGVKSSGASLAFASGIQGAQDIPASTSTRTSVSAPKVSTPSQGSRGSGRYPLAQTGKLIGFPYQGTHTLGNWQSDRAYDIAVPVGTPMLALQDGVVVKVTRHPQGAGRFAGDQITIRGANGNEYFYAHGKATVNAGERVRKGQELGTSGSANGVQHLHFAQMRGNPKQHLTASR